MKATKLIIGILSCILFAFVTFQSCAVGLAESLEGTDGASGGAGIIVSVLLITAGIVAIVTRNKPSGGGTVACIILYGLAGVVGLTMHGVFEDLIVWGGVCIIFAVLLLVFQIVGKKSAGQEVNK